MAHPLRYILTVGTTIVVLALGGASLLWAQGTQEGAVRRAGTVANIFGTLDPGQPLDGVQVTTPSDWRVEEVRLLRYGTEPVAVRLRQTDEPGTYLVTTKRSLRGPHDLLLRVQLPETPGSFRWALETLVREDPDADSVARPAFRTIDRRTHSLRVEAPPTPGRTNQALSLAEAEGPLFLRADAIPALGERSSFTIEFWLRTSGLDEVVLSTWNGRESVAYPAEFVVDRGGRLRFYAGRPGDHQALRTGRPVADDKWHHVAAVYDARQRRLRLLLNGTAVDSLRGRVPTPAPGPIALAVGGRLEQDQGPNEARPPLFTGQLDELRVWPDARSVELVRRAKSRPFRQPDETSDERRFVRLGFDAEESLGVERWPAGARRVPTTLSFRSSLRNLRAQTEGRSVTLQWTAEASDPGSFVVERSAGGETFTKIAELDPTEARRAAASDVPTFTYTDEEVDGQVVFYRIRLKQEKGPERTSGTIKIGLGPEAERRAPVRLIGNFPNPFDEQTTIAYEVNEAQPITITVWNLEGHRIAQLADSKKGTGYHEAPFDAANLPSGTYFVELKTPTETLTHRMVVLK